MDDRDKDLDDLQQDLKKRIAQPGPHIERPDELDMGQNGICWRDRNRGCTAACIAYNAGEPEEPEPAMRCTLIKQKETTNQLLLRLVHLQEIKELGGAETFYTPPDPMGKKL